MERAFGSRAPTGSCYETDGSSSGTLVEAAPNGVAIEVAPAAVSPTSANGLYASTNKVTLGVQGFSSALPTAAGTTNTTLTGIYNATAPESYAFFFANPTTMFVADADDGIQEWTSAVQRRRLVEYRHARRLLCRIDRRAERQHRQPLCHHRHWRRRGPGKRQFADQRHVHVQQRHDRHWHVWVAGHVGHRRRRRWLRRRLPSPLLSATPRRSAS